MTQLDLFDWSQRWEEGKARWCPRRRLVDTSTLEVALCPDAEARAFVEAHHYSRSWPSSRERIGLYRSGALVGVAVFGVPASEAVLPRWTTLTSDQAADLSRFVLLDEVGFNAETWFLARAFKLLRKQRPAWRRIVAFSDPHPRHTLSGECVMPGHVGQIYQAYTGAYQGRTLPSTQYQLPDGRIYSKRAAQKLTRGEVGAAYAARQLEEAGISPMRAGESGDAYWERVKGELRKVRHQGQHAYLFSLTGERLRDLHPKPSKLILP